MRTWLLSILVIFLFTGCTGGAVVFAPTPVPLDISPLRYEHPSKAFSVVVPRTWGIYEQHAATLATATFSPPGSSEPQLTIAVMNLGQVVDDAQMRQLMHEYQTQVRPDLVRYTESDRAAMGDGSFRLSGVRDSVVDQPMHVNTFIEQQGTYIGVLEVVVPVDDTGSLSRLQAIINTFQINPNANLQPTQFNVLSFTTHATLELLNVATWTTPAGVFFITGEVANYSSIPLVDVPVRGAMWSEDGTGVAEALDTVMGYVIPPGGFAPFSLRFGQGQPQDAVSYTITVGGETWLPETAPEIYGSDELIWTDERSYNEVGHLRISGTITNISPYVVYAPRAIVTLFDEGTQVVAAGFAQADADTLQPGEETIYSVLVPDMGGTPAKYFVNVQALAEPPE